jgi:hypothetical protein
VASPRSVYLNQSKPSFPADHARLQCHLDQHLTAHLSATQKPSTIPLCSHLNSFIHFARAHPLGLGLLYSTRRKQLQIPNSPRPPLSILGAPKPERRGSTPGGPLTARVPTAVVVNKPGEKPRERPPHTQTKRPGRSKKKKKKTIHGCLLLSIKSREFSCFRRLVSLVLSSQLFSPSSDPLLNRNYCYCIHRRKYTRTCYQT